MKKMFTTDEVTRICKVNPRTVSKWLDSGRISSTQDRRVSRDHLVQFLKEHGMPLGELEKEDVTPVESGAEYIELNLSNYDNSDVEQLNNWAIEAFDAIESITGEAAFSGLPESKQDALSRLIGEPASG